MLNPARERFQLASIYPHATLSAKRLPIFTPSLSRKAWSPTTNSPSSRLSSSKHHSQLQAAGNEGLAAKGHQHETSSFIVTSAVPALVILAGADLSGLHRRWIGNGQQSIRRRVALGLKGSLLDEGRAARLQARLVERCLKDRDSTATLSYSLEFVLIRPEIGWISGSARSLSSIDTCHVGHPLDLRSC